MRRWGQATLFLGHLAIRGAPRLLMPLAALFPLAFAWVSGSGMAQAKADREAAAALRETARAAGFPVGAKGRLPKAFLDTL